MVKDTKKLFDSIANDLRPLVDGSISPYTISKEQK